MLLEALRESINLPFVRLLRDLIRHDIYQNAGSKVQLLADDKDPRRADYLDRFVDKESQVYLRRFWVKYRDKDANQRLETFLDGCVPGRCGWPRSTATCSHRPTWRASAPSSANACPAAA